MGATARAAANDRESGAQLSSVDDNDDDDQADDPVSKVVGDLGGLADGLGDVDLHAGETEEDDPDVLPPGFDVFRIKPEVIDRMLAAGAPVQVVKVNVLPVVRGKRRAPIKRLRPEGMTFARLREALAPGTYDLQAFNEDGTYMGGKRIRINGGDFDSLDEFDELGGAGGFGGYGRPSRGRGTMADRLVYELAMRGMRGGESQGRSSEMSSAITDFAKLMALQAQMASTQMQAQLKALEVDAKRSRSETGGQLSTIKTIVELMDKRTPKTNGTKGTKIEEVIGLLQLGMTFQKNMDGKSEGDSDELRKWVLPLADSLGPQLVGLIAMALPKDKAELLTDLLEEHLRSRSGQSSDQDDDDKETFDTTAEEVPKV